MTGPSDSRTQLEQRRSTWPTVLGIIAVIVACLGLFSYGICQPATAIGSPLLTKFFENLPNQQQTGNPGVASLKAASSHAPLTLALDICFVALGVLLLVGAIRLLKRRPSSRKLLNIWAALRLVMMVPQVAVGLIVQSDQMRIMNEQGADPMGVSSSPAMHAMMYASVVISALFCLVLPVFTLIWLNRTAIRNELATWSPAPPVTDRYAAGAGT